MLLNALLEADRHFASVQVKFVAYWTTKQTLANTLVQFGHVDHQTLKSKLNGPRVHFPYMSYWGPMSSSICSLYSRAPKFGGYNKSV
jgi:hypothetical protein